jgi:hypothetical protein
VQQHLGVAAGAEACALRLQLGAERLEVIDLAVEDDGQPPVLRPHRLGPAGQVDDRQPPMAERHARLQVRAFAVRTAMGDRVGHLAKQGRVERRQSFGIEEPGQTAHACS